VSCLGKTFTAILNNRLSQLSDEIKLIIYQWPQDTKVVQKP
jgi:hypothetical protein